MDGTSATWLARLTTKSNRVASSKMRCSASPARNHAERVDLVVPSTIRQWLRLDCLSLGSHPLSGNIEVANQTLGLETGIGLRNGGDRNAVGPAQVSRRPSLELGLIPRVDVLGSLGLPRQLCCDHLVLGLHDLYQRCLFLLRGS